MAAAFAQPQTVQLPPLPQLPQAQLDSFEPWIREQIQDIWQEAQSHPDDAERVGRLGMLLHAHELHDQAAACYERSRQLDPEPFRWIYYLARVRSAQGQQPQLAAELYREAERRNPNYLPAQLELIDALLKAGQIDEAEQKTMLLLQARSDSAWVHYDVGRVKEAREQIEEAAQAYKTASELAPRFGPAHYALGLLYRRLGRPQEARQHLQRYQENRASVPPADDPLMDAIESLRSGPYHLVEEAKRLQERGEIGEALQKYTKALELNPQLIPAHVNLISIHAMQGEFEAARTHYQAAVRLNPQLAETHYNYGLALSQQKLYGEAEESFRKAIQSNPYFSDAYNNLGAVLEAQGKLAEARDNYAKAVENGPNREASFSLGRLAMKEDRPAQAIEFLLNTLTPEDNKTPTFLYTLAYAYAGTKDFVSARRYGEKARALADAYSDQRMVETLDRFLAAVNRAEGAAGSP